MRVICTCMVCKSKWEYRIRTKDQLGVIKASQSPCGHQGLFETEIKSEMKIIAEPVKGKDLEPGDLFSTADQFYWDNRPKESIGEKVYIRTETPLTPEQGEEDIYRITIIR